MTDERSWREVAGIRADDVDEIEAAIEAGRERSRQRRERIVNESGDSGTSGE